MERLRRGATPSEWALMKLATEGLLDPGPKKASMSLSSLERRGYFRPAFLRSCKRQPAQSPGDYMPDEEDTGRPRVSTGHCGFLRNRARSRP